MISADMKIVMTSTLNTISLVDDVNLSEETDETLYFTEVLCAYISTTPENRIHDKISYLQSFWRVS
jgi:hypothetical protein